MSKKRYQVLVHFMYAASEMDARQAAGDLAIMSGHPTTWYVEDRETGQYRMQRIYPPEHGPEIVPKGIAP